MAQLLPSDEYQQFSALYVRYIRGVALTISEIETLNAFFRRLRLFKQQIPVPKQPTLPSTTPIGDPPKLDVQVIV